MTTLTFRQCRPFVILALVLMIEACNATDSPAQLYTPQQPIDSPTGAMPQDILKIPQLPVPPNATVAIADTVIVGNDEEWTGQVIMSAPYTVVQITQFYRNEMPKLGWVETAIVRSRRTSVSYTRGNRVATLRITAQRDDEKSTDIDVVVSPIQNPATASPVRTPSSQSTQRR
ncbi:MAG: hypothetical protein GC191_13300 [Azospirillum sp.]|nr:hypothetical protein [Azospirillum sp.]